MIDTRPMRGCDVDRNERALCRRKIQRRRGIDREEMTDARQATSPARLANLWDDEKASASMSEPERLRLPLQHCSVPTSASPITAAATPPPRSWQKDPLGGGHEVEVLWVKGSGGDSRHDQARRLFATLYMDKLDRAEAALSRTSSTRTRWSATSPTAPSTSTRAPPRSTRPCTPMCRESPCRSHAPGRHHRQSPRRRTSQRTDADRSFGDR
jgi:hypothetical protein